MTNKNTAYLIALSTIRAHVDQTQAELDATAAAARVANIAAHRAAALDGIDPESPLYAVAAVVSQTLSIGRESDGFPCFNMPEETSGLIKKALAAGIIPRTRIGNLYFYDDASGLNSPSLPEASADYEAWKTADDYRSKNAKA